jgi:hypothetical protein
MTRAALALCLAIGATALAADQPITGAKLFLKRSASGNERIVFVSKDPNALFPAIGSADDPGTGNPGGALVDLFSTSEPGGSSLAVPATNWTAKPGTTPSHRFFNRSAPDGLSSVRTVVLKRGRLVKVTGKGVGLALATSEGAVGIRITTGSLRNCALFGSSTVRRDEAGVFDAHNATTAGLADCSNTSLGGTEPTTTTSTSAPDTTSTNTTTSSATTSTSPGSSSTSCPSTTTTTTLPLCEGGQGFPLCASGNSVCFNGHTCVVDFNAHTCACTGPPPTCGQWGVQACGDGTCPAGETCALDNIAGPGCPLLVIVCHCVPSP